jgi:chaperonin GroEL
MLKKRVTHKDEMYIHIKEGIDSIASIVGRTLGPGGLPILIERVGQALNGEPLGPMITKDGVTVANECASDDPQVDVVIQAVKDICSRTNRVAGDGTTTAIVLGKALLDATLEIIEREHLNPQQVKVSLEAAAKQVLLMLDQEATECRSYDMIEHVATISANGDREIGQVIRGAFEAVGTEGIITVDEGGGSGHTLTVVDGFQIRRGAEAQDRFFNSADKNKFEAENAHVVMYDGKLNNAAQVIPVLQMLWEHHKGKMPPVVLMANEFSPEVLQLLLINRAESGLSVCAIRNPHQTTVTTAMLDDMAVYLGGERLGNGNKNMNNVTYEDVGIAKRIVVDKYTTTFFGGAGEESDVLVRIEQLKVQREEAESPYDAALISDRISSLAEGIAKIGVGGLTDLEVKEKYHRIEDAVNAARAAIAEGVIPGGGATLMRISTSLDPASSVGNEILRTALSAPFFQILANLGTSPQDSEGIRTLLLNTEDATWDGVTGAAVNALEAGIIDPVKVTKTALLNAMSIAALLSTCGGAITYSR